MWCDNKGSQMKIKGSKGIWGGGENETALSLAGKGTSATSPAFWSHSSLLIPLALFVIPQW